VLANVFVVKAATSLMDVAIAKPSSNHQSVQSLALEGLSNKWWMGIAFAFVKKAVTMLVDVVTAK